MEPPRPGRGVAYALLRRVDGTVADKLFAVTALEDDAPFITGPLCMLALPIAKPFPALPDGTVVEPRIDRIG